MNTNNISALKQKYEAGRKTLASILIFTVVNVVLYFVKASFYFPYCIFLPYQMFIAVSQIGFAELNQYGMFLTAVSAVIFAGSILCYFGSKKKASLILLAAILIFADTLYLVYTTVVFSEMSNLIDVLFHAIALYGLIVAQIAGKKLMSMAEEANAESLEAFLSVIQPDSYPSSRPAVDQSASIAKTEEDIPPSVPMRSMEEKNGRIILNADYNGMNVCVRRCYALTELIIDGNVYAERPGVIEAGSYSLKAKVGGVLFRADYVNAKMSLYANGILLAKKQRIY